MHNMAKLNEYAKWTGIGIAILAIVWNAFTLHFSVKENTAVLQNDVVHLKADITEIKADVKSINHYLLTRSNE